MKWKPVSSTFESARVEYVGLARQRGGPTQEVAALSGSPIDLFFYFFPKALLIGIAKESTQYGRQQAKARAVESRKSQKKSQSRRADCYGVNA